MTDALVTCIIPVFNGEAFVRAALDSVLAQSYRPLEVVVVDDGSTDGTREVVAGYGGPVRYVGQTNAGPATARNTGLRVAAGAFISFLDADDLWHPQKLSRQMELLTQRRALAACVTLVQNFWTPELASEERRFRDHPRGQPIPGYTTVALVARRTLFQAIGRFDTGLRHGDTTDWFLRAERHGVQIALVPEVLVYRRLHQNNRSRQWEARSRDEYLQLVRSHLGRRRAEQPQASGEGNRPRPDPPPADSSRG